MVRIYSKNSKNDFTQNVVLSDIKHSAIKRWRKRGDSNPRTQKMGCRISSAVHSTTLPLFRKLKYLQYKE